MGVLDDLNEADWVLHHLVEEATSFLIEIAPILKRYSTDILLDLVFVPRIVARQMALALLLETGRFAVSQCYHQIYRGILVHLVSSRARMLRQLTQDQQTAQTQDQFMMLAEQMDVITGNREWRMDPDCPLYERERIASTIDHYLHLMRRQEVFDLLYLLRGNLGRNHFGLMNKSLFMKAQAGTKVLVETYHNVVCAALEFVCDANAELDDPDDPNYIPTEARLAFFNEVRHAYGRTSLLLSGGAALGFYHVGVVKALMENNLMPRVIGGSSAGSIVCAMIGTRTDEECINDLFQLRGTVAPGHSGRIQLDFFRPLIFVDPNEEKNKKQSALKSVYKNNAGAFRAPKRHLQLIVPRPLQQVGNAIWDLLTGNKGAGDLLANDTEHFKSVVKANCGNFTFQEAFDRTGRICNIIVSPKNQSDPPRLLNYLTAPHVLIWSAAVASASVPGIFESHGLLVKDPDGTERYESSTVTEDGVRTQSSVQFQDGSFEKDLPTQQISELFNVNHFIISQVNPQAVLFGSFNHRSNVWSNPIKGVIDSLLRFLKHQCRSWILNLVKCLGSRRFAPIYAQTRSNIGTQILTQEYEGRECDISLIPWRNHQGIIGALLHMLYNPTSKDFFEWMAVSERETWNYIPRIKCHIAEEIALDQCVQRLRNRLILESRQKRLAAGISSKASSSRMGRGLPSFYASPSLTKLDNGDNREPQAEQYSVPLKDDSGYRDNLVPTAAGDIFDMNSGWAGMGLRGNRSSGSLDRLGVQVSHDSGIFFDAEEDNPQQPHDFEQQSGETPPGPCPESKPSSTLTRSRSKSQGSETGSMATFYYRRASRTNLDSVGSERLQRGMSDASQHKVF